MNLQLREEVALAMTRVTDAGDTRCLLGVDSPPEDAVAHLRARRRLKLWQIDCHYHCSIVGTCLGPADLEKAVRNSGTPMPAGPQEYERHGTFVRVGQRCVEPGCRIESFARSE